MTLPSGVLTATVTFGPYMDDAGAPRSGTVVFRTSSKRVWTATGEVIMPRALTVTLNGSGAGSIVLPATDQPGFSDGAGNSVTNWTYTADDQLTGSNSARRTFMLPTGGVDDLTVDLDLLTPVTSTTGTTVALPSVLSVDGRTGVVVLDATTGFARVVTPEQFGAAGDGTTDDTDAIQAAFDSCVDGGVVQLSPGKTYRFTNVYVGSNTTLAGTGGTSVLAPVYSGALDQNRLHITDVTNVTIRDLVVEESGVVARAGFYGALAGYGSSNIRIDNVEVRASSAAGMHFIDCQNVTVNRCYVHDTKADGVHFQRGSTDCTVSNSTIEHCGDDAVGFVSHDFTTYGHVRNLIVTGCILGRTTAGSPGSGVAICGAIGAVVTGNTIVDTALSGVRVTEFFNVEEGNAVGGDVVITGNTITNSGIYSGAVSGVVTDGISVFNQRNVLVSGNLIDKTVGAGVKIGEAAVNVTIEGNTIVRAGRRGIWCAPTERVGDYLQLWTDALLTDGSSLAYVHQHQVSIRDNTIRACGTDGIYVVGSTSRYVDEFAVTDNYVYQPNTTAGGSISGLTVSFARRSRVAGNFVGTAFNSNPLTSYGASGLIDTPFVANLPYPGLVQKTLVGTRGHVTGAAAPTSGTWALGDVVWNQNPQTTTPLSWVCSTAGTLGTLNGGATTGSITSGSTQLTLSSLTGIGSGEYVTITGVTGKKKIVEMVGLVATLDSVADATVTGAAVAYGAATFRATANVL